ncbi:MAG: SIS domain-containing protein [Candidatus Bruticola sp.]
MCGIAGILYKYSETVQNLNWDNFLQELNNIALAEVIIDNPPIEAVTALEEKVSYLKDYQAFSILWSDSNLADRLRKAADSVLSFEQRSKEQIASSKIPIPTNLVENWNSLGVRLRDIHWTISQDILGNLDKVKLITPDFIKAANLDAWKITAVLNNMDRLEVRGRDSLGISVSLSFVSRQSFDSFRETIEKAGLTAEFNRRINCPTLDNLSIRFDSRSAAAPSLMFVYKVSQEVGALGDNVASIRRSLKEDNLLWYALGSPSVETNVWSHTRWASNGVINIVNSHPVDEQTEPNNKEPDRYWISAALNGDVDNFQALAQKIYSADAVSISPKITTDAKVIPVLVDYHYRRSGNLEKAFIQSVGEFEGSVAICLSSSLEPGRIYLALKGSGQSLFIGLCSRGYVFASEVYGIVEQTNRYIRLDGASEHIPGHPESAGQIFVLQEGQVGLAGLKAFHIDGTPLQLSEQDIKMAEITTRDINRGQYDHFLLKEICDSPNSVAKTLQGKYFIEDKFDGAARINLGPEVFPIALAEKFKNHQINRILLIGQGTAAVAGVAVASMMQRTLSGTDIEVRAMKATELSGYSMEEDMAKTLIIAVSQSGTTTDTNRTVDIVRARHASVLAIVNRRNSDLTYKVDGVMYTSDGRDIEMSVASTKAFYSQVVAGYLLGLHIASLVGAVSTKQIRRELQELLNLPSKISSVINKRKDIEMLARRYATTRRDWAVVGSGSTKAAADEIRIKLSELCYKSIATDYIEDKKHIDLSSEPLTLICTAGLPTMALRDSVKEVAIFRSHKSIPIVIASEGFDEFERYASGVIYVPAASANASVLLNTVVGHLWGYYCAQAINEGANLLKPGRALAVQHLSSDGGLVFNQANIRRMLSVGKAFQDDLKKGRFNSSLSVDSAVRLSLMFQYFTGARSLRQLATDFKGNSLVETMVTLLSQAIQELSRPIDAIKHQAKTITVGISRSDELAEGPIFEALGNFNITPDDLPYRDLSFIRALNKTIDKIVGATLYEIDGLNALNEVTDSTRIKAIEKTGIAVNMRSRSDNSSPLVGTKQWVTNNRRSYVGHGHNDEKPILIAPVISTGRVEHLVLLHLNFKHELSLEERVDVIKNLTNRYGDLVSQVEETNVSWHDEFLNLLSVEELSTLRAAVLAELIIKRRG